MSPRESLGDAAKVARVFAALGDRHRLHLLQRLSRRDSRSISALSAGLDLTRQGVTKHLKVLQQAGLVSSQSVGRENQFTLQSAGIEVAKSYLDRASSQWGDAIGRLRSLVE